MTNYKLKYLKYKSKYLQMQGGNILTHLGFPDNVVDEILSFDNYTYINIDSETNITSYTFNNYSIYIFNNKETYKKYMNLPGFRNTVIGLKINFNEPIDDIVFPTELKILIFGDEFNQPIGSTSDSKLPLTHLTKLTHLKFGRDYNQPIGNWSVPNLTLSVVSFLPPNITKLWFGIKFAYVIGYITYSYIPPAVTELILGEFFYPNIISIPDKTGIIINTSYFIDKTKVCVSNKLKKLVFISSHGKLNLTYIDIDMSLI
jgi:hypothetical protein